MLQQLFSPSARFAHAVAHVGAPFAMGSAFGVVPGHLGRWKPGKSLEAGGLFNFAIPIRLYSS